MADNINVRPPPKPYLPELPVVWSFEPGEGEPYLWTDEYDEKEFLAGLETFTGALMDHDGGIHDVDYTIHGMEVGDDRVDLCTNPNALQIMLLAQSTVFEMKTSKEDTTISSSVWDFCEVTSTIPSAKEQSFDHCRKVNKFQDFGFVDNAPIRLVIDCGKESRDHSSSVGGKAAMLGSKAVCPRSELREIIHQSLMMQDAYLNASRSSEPKYLPRWCGGSNAPALFDKAENIYLATRAFRGGGYSRIYGSAVGEAKRNVLSLEMGVPSSAVLCRALRLKQEYLHGTYHHMVSVPKRQQIAARRGEMPIPLYESIQASVSYRSCEHRMERAGLILDQTGAEIELERKLKLKGLLTGSLPADVSYQLDVEKKRNMMKQYGDRLTANTAFQRLLQKNAAESDILSLQDAYHVVTTGQKEFSIEDSYWIFNGSKGDTFTAFDIPFSEAYYLREEVDVSDTLKVPGIVLTPHGPKGPREVVTTTKIGLYQISGGQEQWARDLAYRLRDRRDELGKPVPFYELTDIMACDTEWVNDDTFLIQKARRMVEGQTEVCTLFLVSADAKLGRRMADSLNICIYLLDPRKVVTSLGLQSFSSSTKISVEELDSVLARRDRGYLKPIGVLIDTGSVASSLSNIGYDNGYFLKELCQTGTSPSRYARYRIKQIDTPRLYFQLCSPVGSAVRKGRIIQSTFARS